MRIVMMGTGTFAEPTLEALLAAGVNVVGVVTQPDRNTGRKGGSTRQTGKGMANIAADAGVPVAQPESINTPDGLAALAAFQPELLVVAAYGQILKPNVIALPTLGAINVHASLLPKYRGASPIAHAILNGETTTGVTIIRITPGLDAGAMLAKASLDILPDETTGALEARLAPLGARLALHVIRLLKSAPVPGEPQDASLVTKAPKLTKEMGAIDWTQSAEQISRQVRAMQPWPTAYTFLHRSGKEPFRVIVNRVASGPALSTEALNVSAGQILAAERIPASGDSPSEMAMVVSCGGTVPVYITELQPAGKKRMTAAEFLRGYPLQPGDRFGPAAGEAV